MTTVQNGIPRDSDRFDYIEHLLTKYPGITITEAQELKRWFKKEASAFDVANMASKETSKVGYAAFRAEHIDPFETREYIVGGLVLLTAVSSILFMTT